MSGRGRTNVHAECEMNEECNTGSCSALGRLGAADVRGRTPARLAAEKDHGVCLRTIAKLLGAKG